MRTVAELRVAPGAEPKNGKSDSADMLPYFAQQASAERVSAGRGVLGALVGGRSMGSHIRIRFLLQALSHRPLTLGITKPHHGEHSHTHFAKQSVCVIRV